MKTKTWRKVLPTPKEQDIDLMVRTVLLFYVKTIIYVNKLRFNLVVVIYKTISMPYRHTCLQKHAHDNKFSHYNGLDHLLLSVRNLVSGPTF